MDTPDINSLAEKTQVFIPQVTFRSNRNVKDRLPVFWGGTAVHEPDVLDKQEFLGEETISLIPSAGRRRRLPRR